MRHYYFILKCNKQFPPTTGGTEVLVRCATDSLHGEIMALVEDQFGSINAVSSINRLVGKGLLLPSIFDDMQAAFKGDRTECVHIVLVDATKVYPVIRLSKELDPDLMMPRKSKSVLATNKARWFIDQDLATGESGKVYRGLCTADDVGQDMVQDKNGRVIRIRKIQPKTRCGGWEWIHWNGLVIYLMKSL